jgi:hypothetical protein
MNPNYQINPHGFIKLKDYWAVRLRGHWRRKYTKGYEMQADKEKKNFSNHSDFDATFMISLTLYEQTPKLILSLNNMEQKLNQLSITPERTAHGQLLFILQSKGLNPMRWGYALTALNDQTKQFRVDFDNLSPHLRPILLDQLCVLLSSTDLKSDFDVANYLAEQLDCYFYRAAYCTLDGDWDYNPQHRLIWNPTHHSFEDFKASVPEGKELFLSYTEDRVASIEEATHHILSLLEKSPNPSWL